MTAAFFSSRTVSRLGAFACVLMAALWSAAPSARAEILPTSALSKRVAERTAPVLELELERKRMRYGAPVFIRVFKVTRTLEVWMENELGKYDLFKTYRICSYSGGLGPKLREGDLQAPEGFYSVTASDLNPRSQFHLSFNLGFPNAYDRSHRRNGNFLMIHGSCISKGCYAMTDQRMEEIYTLVFAALEQGQREIPVHIFPFTMNDANMAAAEKSKWFRFWRNLREGYELFEETRVPPVVWEEYGRYAFFKRDRMLSRRHRRIVKAPVPLRHPDARTERDAAAVSVPAAGAEKPSG